MRAGGGKNKGSEFEREICRKLTKWLFGYEKPEKFWRTSASGAKATMAMRRGQATKMHGDIMSIDREAEFFTNHFYLECRFYQDVDILDMLSAQGLVYKWWFDDCVEKARACNKVPMLIFKKNRSKVYVMLMLSTNKWLEDIFKPYPLNYLKFTRHCKVYEFEDLFRWMDGKLLRTLLG